MVRVAGLHDQVDAGIASRSTTAARPSRRSTPSARVAVEQFARRAERSSATLRPALAEHGISIVGLDDVSTEDARGRSTSATGARSSRC